ncbi:hypothetical protein [Vallitalea sp.]|uniref:hypothetical protein n=1 Tax=Vallitalea sp. TaxID=1882829 RepID=UPI0025E38E7A|nr:hypothetical protein [Vallitalea sp.]MCT4686337.1 hypothetical protein [Vallitalea sp.]
MKFKIVLLLLCSCASVKNIPVYDQEVLTEECFVFDSGLRRIILSFDDDKCKLEQYAKDENGIIKSSLVKSESKYSITKDSLLILQFPDSIKRKYDLYNYFKEIKDKSNIINYKDYLWRNDRGEIPCVDTLRIALGVKRKYLLGARRGIIRDQFYFGTKQEKIVIHIFVYMSIIDEDVLVDKEIRYK